MTSLNLHLIRPNLDLETPFMEMVREFRTASDPWFDTEPHLKMDDFATYIDYLHKGAQGTDLPDGYVPWTALWLVNKETGGLLGVSSLRHRLTPSLEKLGGHIGYAIRPSQRGNGFGTSLLALTLPEARALGLACVHVHCEVGNVASARIIEHNGGHLQERARVHGMPIVRYVIDLTAEPV
ncbi:MAG TPA: GNAT family N-acetyltransferase [Abditibacteriaceae bacterium]|jgi:predicted acetyltransferase